MYIVKSPWCRHRGLSLLSRGIGTETLIQRPLWFPPDDPTSAGGLTNILLYIVMLVIGVLAASPLP